MPPARPYLWAIPLLLVLAFGLRRSLSTPPSDFAGYYYGGRALIHGEYTEAYDMTRLNDRIAADGWHHTFVSYTPFPPFSSLVVAPFLIFRMDVAKTVFNCVSIALFLMSVLRITQYLSTPPYLVLALPVIFFIPLINNLAFGQAYLLLFTFLTEGWLAYRRQRRIRSSLFWAAAILFKVFPAFLFLFLLLRKRYRDALSLGIGCAFLFISSLLINGTAAWNFYIFTITPRMNLGELNDSFTYVFQSGFMLFKRAFHYDQLLNPYPVADNPWLFTVSLAVFQSLVLTPAILLTIRCAKEKDDFLPFTVWIAASMLISPSGSSYSLVLLLLPLLAFAHPTPPPAAARPAREIILAILLLTAACVIPVDRFGALPLLAQFPRLYLLLLFYLLLNLQRPNARSLSPRSINPRSLSLAVAFAALFFAFDIRGNLPAKDPGSYVLTNEQHLFVNDFTTRDNHLIYSWRDDKGTHEQRTDYPVYSLANDRVKIQNNQIWYNGQQITASPDRKAKPAVLNGNRIIYLSDQGRGFEFYTLREIKLAAKPPDTEVTPGSSR